MRVADGLMQETPKSLIWLRFTAEPRTGRFITRDSYRGERENADTWHLYAYCANNPINYVDPSGHFRSFGIYSAKHTFKYTFWKALWVSVTMKINWEVSKKKIISCKAKITRKKTNKFVGIKKLYITGVKKTNRKQRATVRAFIMLEAKDLLGLV